MWLRSLTALTRMTGTAPLSDTVMVNSVTKLEPPMISGAREKDMMEAANLLLDARRTHKPIADLPAEFQPASLDEVARVHEEMILAYGEIGGWKIGAGSPDATPFFAPMPRAWMAASGAILSGPSFRYRVLECEIAFLLGSDLPPRATPYTREEVVAAIASCHPIIEELESGLIDPKAANNFSALADLQMHGGFIYGAACADWQSIDFSKETVTLTIDGAGPRRTHRLQHLRRPHAPAALPPPPPCPSEGSSTHRRPQGRAMDHHRKLDRQHARNGRRTGRGRLHPRRPRYAALRLGRRDDDTSHSPHIPQA